ncbi:MAG TPA: hypothetical protein VFW45_09680, partial [Candidatus Polarisedimenticolia bacterium]|nr:hypothetical protein [Candidatus Polarisedimenticolia bacterium]
MAVCVLLLELLGSLSARAAVPPTTINYQGVLRDQNDNPLSGSYDVVLRFMDAAAAGNEILIDQHTAATGNAVTVSGGLFNVAIGSGTVADGSGAGTYTALDAVFRDYGSVWLEVKVGAETLSPRTPIRSSPYALNSTQLAGHPDSYFINTSSSQIQVVDNVALQGNLHTFGLLSAQSTGTAVSAYNSGPSANPALIASSDVGPAGRFTGASAGVEAQCGFANCTGVQGIGTLRGGYFTDWGSSTASLGGGGYGVQSSGTTAGGYFTGPSGVNATLAGGGLGISATGTNVGGYFSDGAPWFAYTQIPYHDLGIYAYGSTAGGQFNAFSTGNYALLAYSSYK